MISVGFDEDILVCVLIEDTNDLEDLKVLYKDFVDVI